MLVGGLGNILFQLNLIYLMNTSKQIKKEFSKRFLLEKSKLFKKYFDLSDHNTKSILSELGYT